LYASEAVRTTVASIQAGGSKITLFMSWR